MSDSTHQQRILIIGPSWVGDMVMAQTLFKVLKQRHGDDTQIDVLAPEWSLPILDRMIEVRRGIVMPLGHGSLDLTTRYQLGKSLRLEQYDQAIVLPNSLKSAFVPAFAKIPLRTGWLGEMRYFWLNDHRKLDKDQYPLMIERFVALADDRGELPNNIPFPSLSVDQTSLDSAMTKFELHHQQKILALCPGAEFGDAKRWPERHYAVVAQRAIEAGWQVFLFGSEKDRPGCERIAEQAGAAHCRVLAGKTALSEAVDLLSIADAVVANDSGLMHVAAALARPMVVVYGSTSPKFTPPLADNVSVASIDLDCAPCFKRECPFGHNDCLNQLEPQQVISALAGVCEAWPQPQSEPLVATS